jgi:hypothetical protein
MGLAELASAREGIARYQKALLRGRFSAFQQA